MDFYRFPQNIQNLFVIKAPSAGASIYKSGMWSAYLFVYTQICLSDFWTIVISDV